MRRDETFIVFNFDDYWTRFSDVEDGFFCLSERDVALLLDVLRPAHWPSRWVGDVSGVGGDEYRRALLRNNGRFEDLETALSFIERLEHKLMTSCSDALLQGLEAIAAAIAGQNYQSIITQNCGGGDNGACSGGSVDLSNGENLQPSPELELVENEPPTGFDTWGDYLTYKCEAANFVFDWLAGSIRGLSGVSGLYGILAITGPLIVGLLVPTIVLGPLAFVALIAAIIAMAGLGLAGFVEFGNVADGMNDNRQDIVCRLYQAQNTTGAINAVLDKIEEIVTGLGLPSALQAAMMDVIGHLFPNEVANKLFQLSLDVNYVNADCSSCENPECFDALIAPFAVASIEKTVDGDNVIIDCTGGYIAEYGQTEGGWIYDVENFPGCACATLTAVEFISGDPGTTPISVNWRNCDGSYGGTTMDYHGLLLPFDKMGFWFGLTGNTPFVVRMTITPNN